jgi:outer membrane protein
MNSYFRVSLTAVLSAITLAPPVHGALPLPGFYRQRLQGEEVRVRAMEGIEDRIQDGKLYLRLKDFIALVLKNNTDIQITRLDVLNTANSVLAARSPFDPALGLGFSGIRTQAPQFSQIGGAEQLNSLSHQGQIGYQQALTSGQIIDLGFTSARTSSNSRFSFFNPSIMTGLNIGITQPLLQNRGNLQLRTPLRIAKTQLLITTNQTEARIADTVSLAARQYWDAVQARDNIKVQQLAVDLAQKSYDRDRMALELGALPDLEIYQSKSQVAQRKVGLIQAQYAYSDALDGLRRLIGADLNPATRNIEIVVEDDPASVPSVSPLKPVNEAVEAALKSRPELKAIQQRYVVDGLNARLARNSMLPRLDLGVQVGANGLGGNQIPVSGPLAEGPGIFIPGGVGDALHQLFSFKSPFYGFSIQMTLPVRSSAAQARLADALVSKARNQYQQRQVEQQVIQEVKSATNQLEMAKAQTEAAQVARDLAQKNVEAQQQKYELGGITAFELLDSQSRLANVESMLINSYANYQKALISYQRANWTLLDGMGIIVPVPKVD